MPRYAPLPLVSIDPRNEAQLVQDASQRVYEASNGTLNDFSSGNPLAALLEGQAFAQGELLFWANQLPEKILIDWIGPFLGAMRRLGTPAAALVNVSIPPQNKDITIPAGSTFSTDSQLTSGQSILFLSSADFTIPSGSTSADIPVYSKYVGTVYNSPANSITIPPSIGVTGITCSNPQPAVGGSDVETDAEVKQRFFTLIRRRNPVSQSDWEDFFIDLFGEGTITSVQPNRSSSYSYDYTADYIKPNGQVAFFVLGPNGEELTKDQIRRGQNVINFSVPVENQGHLYPISLSQAQYNLTLEVNSNGTFGSNYKAASLDFRDRANLVLQPGNVFPSTINPTVSDIDAAFYSTFDSTTRFQDPHILSSAVYNTPNSLSKDAATYTTVKNFEASGDLLSSDDLAFVKSSTEVYYPVETSFTPYSTDKCDQTIYGNLELKQIQNLTTGIYQTGDVVYLNGNLHVVCESLSVNFDADIQRALSTGKISAAKVYSPWVVGNSYTYSSGSTIDPQILEYEYGEDEFKPTTIVGRLVWLVSKNFTLNAATNGVTGAMAGMKLGPALNSGTQNLSLLQSDESYSAGTWVYTPQIGSGPNFEVDPFYHYVDKTKGAIRKFAKVLNPFTYQSDSLTTSEYFDLLVSEGVIKEINTFDATDGLPVYKYKPRFKCGQYLEYRETAVSEPTYLIATRYFTPHSTNLQDLLSKGSVLKLAPTAELQSQLLNLLSVKKAGRIKNLLTIDSGTGLINGTYWNLPLVYYSGNEGLGKDAKINIVVENNEVVYSELSNYGYGYKVNENLKVDPSLIGGTGTEFTVKVSSLFPYEEDIKPFAKMFTFFKGEKTFFRNGNSVQAYTATSSVTPLFDFSVYVNNGVFTKSENYGSSAFEDQTYIPFFSPEYVNYAEDSIIDSDGKNIYRVMAAFTPDPEVVNWSRTVTSNSPRIEEYAGNLLRYVTLYQCEENVLSQYDIQTSAFKLGVAHITIVPKGSGNLSSLSQKQTFVWENAAASVAPELSWYSGTSYQYEPPNYSEGTLRL
jgi:hypothetical protein